jgi:hypothetical protein
MTLPGEVRDDFPLLALRREVVYLDSTATRRNQSTWWLREWAAPRLRPGDEVVVTSSSTTRTCCRGNGQASEACATLKIVPVSASGEGSMRAPSTKRGQKWAVEA